MEGNETTKFKADYFYKKECMIHISMKNSIAFFNGKLLNVEKDFLVIEDRVIGETPISFENIKDIRKFQTMEEKDE